ncbi:melanoma-associated antigen B4-like [Grammomys surdaster]|uniref:melanoma-associated antigen B4-like n=1 Tax=Grammomys surdaster TaxID=491861 RepID=UPI00109FF083|nr:melanoma-associated antigen B4-like [Grammomys surdaster]XP_028620865.1 melanoma-associated antigen B4-like [Grammomys surdaster]
MPRGKKSKARAREKRREVQEEAQRLKDAEAKAAEKGESASCSDHDSGDAVASSSTAGFPQGKAPTTSAGKGMAHKRSGKGAKGQEAKNGSSCRSLLSSGSKHMDLLSKKTGLLVEYMLCKYKIKQPARRGEMLKVINKRFKNHFPDIFKKASHRLDMVFGIELKEVQPHGQTYTLVSKLDFQDDGSESNEMGVPNRGILIPLLSVIYLNGYCAPEKEVWKFLNMLGVYDEVPHLIFGNVRKLITEDLVQEMYLEYRQVPDSDPPSYEFLWGPRAYVESSKRRVLDFLVKISETMPSAYSSNYEQALIEEEEKAQAEAAAKAGTKRKAKRHSKSKLSNPTGK